MRKGKQKIEKKEIEKKERNNLPDRSPSSSAQQPANRPS
jgi:hypothetical protein